MRIPTRLVALGITGQLAMAALASSQTPSQEFLLSEGKAGPIEIGMAVDEIIRRFGRQRVLLVDLAKEGLFTPAIEIDVPGASLRGSIIADIAVHCGEFSVSGISVRDPKFRTLDGLGVGSTLGQLRRARSIRVSHEEGVSAVVQGEKMTFCLAQASATDNTRVSCVWLYAPAKDVPCRNQ